MGYGNLFQTEQGVVHEAQEILATGFRDENQALGHFQWLLGKYRKLFKQTRRIVQFSDRMQNELNRLNKQLFRSESKYRNLFENAVEGIFRSDPHGGLIDVNPAMARILGYSSPTHILKKQSVKSALEAQEGYRQLFSVVVKNGGCKQYQTELIRKEGDCIWVEFSAQAIIDETGSVAHIDGLLLDITERKKLHERLTRLAHTDALTGIYNRRCFTEKLQQEVRRARDLQFPLSLIMIDVDYFKSVNDRFGHGVGDQVLKRITVACQKVLRENDIFGRLGGEEFAVILPDVDLPRSGQIAERLREGVEKDDICIADDVVRTTISVGLCTLNGNIADSEGLLRAADMALYRAKHGGRNRVCVYHR